MTRIEVGGGRLKAEVLGWDKLWAFKSRLDFPLDHVAGARRWDPKTDNAFRGIRAPGTCLPGVIVAGTYHRQGRHIFYDVHRFKNAIVIELRNQWYTRLVLEVEDPEAVLERIAQSATSLAEA